MYETNGRRLFSRLFALAVLVGCLLFLTWDAPGVRASCDNSERWACFESGGFWNDYYCSCEQCSPVERADCQERGGQFGDDCVCRFFTYCDPVKEGRCFESGGVFSHATCTCTYGGGPGCDNFHYQECSQRGGTWNNSNCSCSAGCPYRDTCIETPGAVWNPNTCTCDYP